MPRRPEDSPNWGGKRAGSGRKPKDNACRATIGIRVPQHVADECKALGSTKFLRPIVIAAIERASGRAPAGKAADVPGFDPLDKAGFAKPAPEPDCAVPLVDAGVPCGFPSPALDYAKEELSLTDLLVRNKFATFFVRADGDSMVDAGIWDGDLLVVDRSVEPRSGDIVMAYLHGDFTIKTLRFEAGRPVLHPENAEADYPVIRPTEYDDFRVEGVVMWNLRRQRR